ncbi:MAG: cache domain-containing sensor histidine kinase [Betaproteobacteria bacterium]
MSQRARILWVIVLAILPLVALSAFGLWQQVREAERRIAAERLRLAQAAAFATGAFLEGQVAAARALAQHPAIAGASAPSRELAALVARLAGERPEWEGIGVIGADGTSIAGSLGGPPIYLGDRPYFRKAVESGRPVVSATLPTDRFGSSLMAKIDARSVALTAIDAEGQAFIRPDPDDLTSLRRLSGPEIDAVLAGQAGTAIKKAAAETLVAYAPVSGFGWGVLLAEPTASAFAPLRAEAFERAAVLAVILAVVFALGWILAGRVALYFERIFARFERGANVAGRFSGTGIGLAVARQIVEQHGGSIAAQSELGQGSTFTLHFPFLRVAAQENPAESSSCKPSS